MQGFVLN